MREKKRKEKKKRKKETSKHLKTTTTTLRCRYSSFNHPKHAAFFSSSSSDDFVPTFLSSIELFAFSTSNENSQKKIFLRKKFHTFYFRNVVSTYISSRHTARQTVLDTFLGEGVSKKKYCTSSSSKCKCVPRAAKDIQRGKGNINAFESCEGDDIERW